MERCEVTDLTVESCARPRHRNSPGYRSRSTDGTTSADAGLSAPVSADIRLNPPQDGEINRADCWHLMGIDGFQDADWDHYLPVDATYVRGHRDQCCSTSDPGARR